MTHGCIKIKVKGESEERTVLLHTPHSGQHDSTVEWIKSVPAFYADHRAGWLTDYTHAEHSFLNHIYDGSFAYQLSTAALIVAVRPNVYEPVPPAFVEDLPKWSGIDTPVTLTIEWGGSVTWHIRYKTPGGRWWTQKFKPIQAALKHLKKKIKADEQRATK